MSLVAIPAFIVLIADTPSLRAQDRNPATQAFSGIAAVLASPRCANCHVSGDSPLQGDAAQVHTMNVRRGADGRGAVGMRCGGCHQEASSLILHAPPGAPDWRLPPPSKRMAWRGLTAGEQCRMLKDPAMNGNRTLADLLDHATNDPLVLACWHPGAGRTPPPVSHADFVRSVKTWIDGGAACPQ